MLRAFLLSTVTLLALVMPALAGPELADDVTACRDRQNDPKARLDACETVIAAGQVLPKVLAVALAARGEALLQQARLRQSDRGLQRRT